MAKTIAVSDATFEKMKSIAEPLEDDADSVLTRVLDFYIDHQEIDYRGGQRLGSPDLLELDPEAPGDLKHTKLRRGSFGDRRVTGRNWSQLVETAHEVAVERCESFEKVRHVSPFNLKNGKYEQRGYHFFPSADISVQYKSAPDVWEGCLRIAQRLSVPVEVEFEWLDKEKAAHPDKRGRLSWQPE